MAAMEFRDRVALVTGGSSGIGLALARGLAAKGAHVWIVARDQAKLRAALAHIQADCAQPGQNCGLISADIADAAQAANAVAEVTEKAGLPDLLINSAGIAYSGYFQDLDLSVFRDNIEINYFGTLNVLRAAVPGMINRRSGHIVNISSLVGVFGMFGYSAYAPSKFAVRGLSDVLRSELREHGIRVSIVYPPDTDTPQLAFDRELQPPELTALSANGTVLSPEVVAAEILRGVARGREVILPGPEAKFLYWLAHISGSGGYRIMDFMMARAKRDLKGKKQ